MKTTILLITLIWTALSFAHEVPESINFQATEDRIQTLVSQSKMVRESASPQREIASFTENLKEFDALMADDSNVNYLELASQY